MNNDNIISKYSNCIGCLARNHVPINFNNQEIDSINIDQQMRNIIQTNDNEYAIIHDFNVDNNFYKTNVCNETSFVYIDLCDISLVVIVSVNIIDGIMNQDNVLIHHYSIVFVFNDLNQITKLLDNIFNVSRFYLYCDHGVLLNVSQKAIDLNYDWKNINVGFEYSRSNFEGADMILIKNIKRFIYEKCYIDFIENSHLTALILQRMNNDYDFVSTIITCTELEVLYINSWFALYLPDYQKLCALRTLNKLCLSYNNYYISIKDLLHFAFIENTSIKSLTIESGISHLAERENDCLSVIYKLPNNIKINIQCAIVLSIDQLDPLCNYINLKEIKLRIKIDIKYGFNETFVQTLTEKYVHNYYSYTLLFTIDDDINSHFPIRKGNEYNNYKKKRNTLYKTVINY